jgi:hypothetical protein
MLRHKWSSLNRIFRLDRVLAGTALESWKKWSSQKTDWTNWTSQTPKQPWSSLVQSGPVGGPVCGKSLSAFVFYAIAAGPVWSSLNLDFFLTRGNDSEFAPWGKSSKPTANIGPLDQWRVFKHLGCGRFWAGGPVLLAEPRAPGTRRAA